MTNADASLPKTNIRGLLQLYEWLLRLAGAGGIGAAGIVSRNLQRSIYITNTSNCIYSAPGSMHNKPQKRKHDVPSAVDVGKRPPTLSGLHLSPQEVQEGLLEILEGNARHFFTYQCVDQAISLVVELQRFAQLQQGRLIQSARCIGVVTLEHVI